MREGIRDFIVRCSEAGRSQKTTYVLYVTGKDPCGDSTPATQDAPAERSKP